MKCRDITTVFGYCRSDISRSRPILYAARFFIVTIDDVLSLFRVCMIFFLLIQLSRLCSSGSFPLHSLFFSFSFLFILLLRHISRRRYHRNRSSNRSFISMYREKHGSGGGLCTTTDVGNDECTSIDHNLWIMTPKGGN